MKAEFRNPQYAEISAPLFPEPKGVKLWTDYFLRWPCYFAGLNAIKAIKRQKRKMKNSKRKATRGIHSPYLCSSNGMA